MTQQFHLIIYGDVRGVGYRAWMKREAENLHIVGWVKNREDGTVEAIIQGKRKQIQQIITLCRKGPDVAWVSHIDEHELPVIETLFNFQVVY